MLDFAMRAKADGHDVRWFFKRDDRSRNYGKGLVDIIADWRTSMPWADLVVLEDNTVYLLELDRWRQHGVPIIGATKEASTWELDRKTGQEVFKKHGIPVPPFKEFSNYDQAIAYVKKENRAFVSKPSYDESDKSLSYVAKSATDLIYMLERWKKAKKLKGAFILQEKIDGSEMAVGAWCGPHGFNQGWCENWEFKSLMAGDRGPNVGEMGTVLRFVAKSKLASKVLAPLEDTLVKMGYVGYVDVNCIIDEDGNPWPLEFTMRMGWPTFNIQQALVKGDHVEWLASLAEGRDSRPFLLNKISTGVVMALPQFPYGKTPMEDVTGVPLYGLTPAMQKNVHLCEAMMGSAPMEQDGKISTQKMLVTAGDYVLVASGTGDSVRQARGKAYRILEKIKAPASPFWRPDIGTRLKKQLLLVQQHGYATGMQY
jgi:phosphoribosylamine--glycine ligase